MVLIQKRPLNKRTIFRQADPKTSKTHTLDFLLVDRRSENCTQKYRDLETYFALKQRRSSKDEKEQTYSFLKVLICGETEEKTIEKENSLEKIWDEISLYFSEDFTFNTFPCSEDYAKEFQEKNGPNIRVLLKYLYLSVRTSITKLFCEFVQSGFHNATDILG